MRFWMTGSGIKNQLISALQLDIFYQALNSHTHHFNDKDPTPVTPIGED